MPIHCSGKQGTHLQISGNGIAPVEIVTGGGAESIQTVSTNSNDYAWWDVRVQTRSSTGSIVNITSTNKGKYHWESFFFTRTPWNGTFINRLTKSSLPAGSSLQSWTSSSTFSVVGQTFKSGVAPVTTYRTIVKDALGLEAFNRTSSSGQFVVTELQCGCADSDCQMGTFPTDFCCTNCAEQSGILSGILGALRGVG
jgi:hypothetical protein